MDDESDLPVWQREKIFPEKPDRIPYGVVVGQGKAERFPDLSALANWLRDCQRPGGLIWTPDRERCFPPEEEPALFEALKVRKTGLAAERWKKARMQAGLLLLPALYILFQTGFSLQNQSLGILAVLWIMFGGLPAYEAWKGTRRAARLRQDNLDAEALEVRFEIWLHRQHVPFTKVLLGMLIGVYLVQAIAAAKAGGNLLTALLNPTMVVKGQPTLAGMAEAGLVKGAYSSGEQWRLFTAPFLHGNFLHLILNGLALLYLGRRTEVMARWPHLLLVFLASMMAGGIASAHGLTAPSVGASGGIMGVLGFLLTFELLHGRLVPKPATRRLVAGIIFTMVVGFVGYQFIDNYAHGGGLIAGVIYGLIVFPKSSSAHRPRTTRLDLVFGGLAGLLIVFGAILATAKIKGF